MELWANHSKSCIRTSLFAALPARLTSDAPFTYQFAVASDGKFDLTIAVLDALLRCCNREQKVEGDGIKIRAFLRIFHVW
jgi:hypothetical protein